MGWITDCLDSAQDRLVKRVLWVFKLEHRVLAGAL